MRQNIRFANKRNFALAAARCGIWFILLYLLGTGMAGYAEDGAAVPVDSSAGTWPGPAWASFSSFQYGLVWPVDFGAVPAGVSQPGGDIALTFGAVALRPYAGLQAGLRLSYGWHGDNEYDFAARAALELHVGFALALSGPLAFRPGLSAGAVMQAQTLGRTLTQDSGPRVLPRLGVSAGLSTRLAERSWLSLTPALHWSPGSSLPWTVSFGLGMHKETAWLAPMPAPRITQQGLPALYSPDDDGLNDEFRVSLNIRPADYLTGWSVKVLDADGKIFATLSETPPQYGKHETDNWSWRSSSVYLEWQGRSDDGLLVEPAAEYTLQVHAKDLVGNHYEKLWPFMVDILVIRQADRLKVMVPPIIFPADTGELERVDVDWMLAQNEAVLRRLLRLFSRFPDYAIVVEGHANAVRWRDAASFDREQERELLPLSLARAVAVQRALIALGLSSDRISVLAKGGSEPIFAFSDAANAWRNRRVEFILVRRPPGE